MRGIAMGGVTTSRILYIYTKGGGYMTINLYILLGKIHAKSENRRRALHGSKLGGC